MTHFSTGWKILHDTVKLVTVTKRCCFQLRFRSRHNSHFRSYTDSVSESSRSKQKNTMSGTTKQSNFILEQIKDKIQVHAAENPGTVVSVEGNIGCGKTTMLNYFSNSHECEMMLMIRRADEAFKSNEELEPIHKLLLKGFCTRLVLCIKVLAEPVDKWRNIDGHNALEMFYNEPSRWAMALQTYVQLTMLQCHNEPMVKPIRLMERSIFSAKYCFVDNLGESHIMPPMEHIILTKWFDWIIQTQNIKVDLIVYLQTDPEILHSRIKSRCRHEEESIPLEYIKALHQRHEDWLIHKKYPCPANVLVLDANQPLEKMYETYEHNKGKIFSPSMIQQTVN